MKEATLTYDGVLIASGDQSLTKDALIVEEALSIFINEKPLTVTMQTPGHELELTRGLLYTEGIFKRSNEHWQASVVEKNKQQHITAVNVALNENEVSTISKRSLLSVAACGICGKTELDFVKGHLPQAASFHPQKIEEMFALMRAEQLAFDSSGGCHAAAAFDAECNLLSVMEDVGRHNAVDKVVGDLLFKNQLKQAKYLLVSGRVSYEIVAKTFASGIPLLAAVSAPSSLAVDFAKELGISLLGFCRGNRMTRYS
jgi:FdhD protein